MARLLSTALFGILLLAPHLTLSNWISDNIGLLNRQFEAALMNALNELDKPLTPGAMSLLTTLNGQIQDVPPTALRHWAEGIVAGLVSLEFYIIAKFSIVISVYGEDGAPALAVAKCRAEKGEIVTLVRFPTGCGSRGINSIIKDSSTHAAYDLLEKWLIEWNNTFGQNRIKFVSIMDTIADFDGNQAALETVQDAAVEMGKLHPLLTKKRLAYENASLTNEATAHEDPDYIAANNEISALKLKLYNNDGTPIGELESTIKHIVRNKLAKLTKGNTFKYYFESFSGQGLDTTLLRKAFTYPLMQMLVDINRGAKWISIGYPLGTTDVGFQDIYYRYEPEAMIVIFLKAAVYAKAKNNIDFKLQNTTIVQIDWNSVWKLLIGPENAPEYERAPKEISPEDKEIPSLPIVYRKLVSPGSSRNWKTAIAAAAA